MGKMIRLLLALSTTAALGLSGVSALASDDGYHASPNASLEGRCHGAFGAFSHHFAFSPGFQPNTDAHGDIATGMNGDGNVFNPNAEKRGSCG